MESLLQAVEKAVRYEADTFTDLNWSLKRIYGGRNGIIYRVEDALSPEQPIAVKIRKRDERHRALREFSVLQALKQVSKPVAPQPIKLYSDIATLPGDMVVSTWVDGRVLDDLSNIPFDLWKGILNTFSRLHAFNDVNTPHLVDAVMPIRSNADLIAEIEKRYTKLPDGRVGEMTKTDIGLLFAEFKVEGLKNNQPKEQLSLIACDNNPNNMIENKNEVLFVDWESAGWGDPAYDIADLLVRPNCMGLSSDMRMNIIRYYAKIMENIDLPQRILAYERLLLIFWLMLTSNILVGNDTERFRGTQTYSLDQTTQRQMAYLQKIEAVRSL